MTHSHCRESQKVSHTRSQRWVAYKVQKPFKEELEWLQQLKIIIPLDMDETTEFTSMFGHVPILSLRLNAPLYSYNRSYTSCSSFVLSIIFLFVIFFLGSFGSNHSLGSPDLLLHLATYFCSYYNLQKLYPRIQNCGSYSVLVVGLFVEFCNNLKILLYNILEVGMWYFITKYKIKRPHIIKTQDIFPSPGIC